MKQEIPSRSGGGNVQWRLPKYTARTRAVAVSVMFSLICQLLLPNVALALSSGKSSPDFTSFESVSTTGMVNEFTGQFVYNIPVLDVPGPAGGGYSLSLSYHSGSQPDDDASWVGYGWTLNPGAINRTKRGLPDEYSGERW